MVDKPHAIVAFADDKLLRADQDREILSEYSVSIDQFLIWTICRFHH